MGFHNEETYCVVPINSYQGALASYDFWAVGLNCCSGTSKSFTCGEYKNPRAHAGLRWMRDSQRAFFQLAVQQAEATYGIKANHPLFFTWTEDPAAEQAAWLDVGKKFFFVAAVGYGFLQFFFCQCGDYRLYQDWPWILR